MPKTWDKARKEAWKEVLAILGVGLIGGLLGMGAIILLIQLGVL